MEAESLSLFIECREVPSRGGLALEWAHLATHLAHKVTEAFEILLGGRQTTLGPLLAAAVLEHPCGLLDDRPAILRSC